MDKIEFRTDVSTYGGDFNPRISVAIYINGRDLRDIAEEIELPYATADGEPGLAGNYARLLPDEIFCECGAEDKCTVYGCGCGEPSCWPLDVKIEENKDTVIWSDFELWHRSNWSHEGMGPYVFDRKQYEQEVAKINEWDKLRKLLPWSNSIFKSWYEFEKENVKVKNLKAEDFIWWRNEEKNYPVYPVEYLDGRVPLVAYENGIDEWIQRFETGEVELSRILKPGAALPDDIAPFGYVLTYDFPEIEPSGTVAMEDIDVDDDNWSEDDQKEYEQILNYENPLYCVIMLKLDKDNNIKSLVLSRSRELFRCNFINDFDDTSMDEEKALQLMKYCFEYQDFSRCYEAFSDDVIYIGTDGEVYEQGKNDVIAYLQSPFENNQDEPHMYLATVTDYINEDNKLLSIGDRAAVFSVKWWTQMWQFLKVEVNTQGKICKVIVQNAEDYELKLDLSYKRIITRKAVYKYFADAVLGQCFKVFFNMLRGNAVKEEDGEIENFNAYEIVSGFESAAHYFKDRDAKLMAHAVEVYGFKDVNKPAKHRLFEEAVALTLGEMEDYEQLLFFEFDENNQVTKIEVEKDTNYKVRRLSCKFNKDYN